MFCQNCGTESVAGGMVCGECGVVLALEADSLQPRAGLAKSINLRLVKMVVFFVIAIVVLIMCFSAAGTISDSGEDIMRITSVGGKTLEEAYYRELGDIYAGYATITRAVGIFLAAVLSWIGFKR